MVRSCSNKIAITQILFGNNPIDQLLKLAALQVLGQARCGPPVRAAAMISTAEMPTCRVYRFLIFFLSLQASTCLVRASRSLPVDVASDVGLASSLRSRSLLDLQDDSRGGAAQVKPEKVPHKDGLAGTNWQQFTEMLLARELGSKPPNCAGKCSSCDPCEAVQVAISSTGVQKVNGDAQEGTVAPDDTNYMPEIWRCACGNEYYNP